MNIITTSFNLQDFFSVAYYQRGLKLFRQGKATITNIEEFHQDVIVSSEVKGTHRYFQEIFLNLKEGSPVSIVGNCSCPIGFNCKHVVAVCLDFKENSIDSSNNNNLDATQDFKYLDWSEQLKDALDKSIPEESAEWFNIQIFGGISDNVRFSRPSLNKNEVNIIRHGYTARGNLSKPKISLPQEFLNKTLSFDTTDKIKYQASLLKTCETHINWHVSVINFKNQIGFIALSNLIQSKVVVFNDQQEPLIWNEEPYNLELEYQSENQQYRFNAKIPEQYFLVLCEPPIIINITTQQAQPVITAVSGSVLEQILDMPALSQLEQLDEVLELLEIDQLHRQTASKHKKTLALPNVAEIKTKIIKENPIPYLSFDDKSEYVFKITIQYGGISSYPLKTEEPIHKVKIKGKRYEIHHQFDKELSYIQQLTEYLVPLSERYDIPHEAFYDFGDIKENEKLDKFIKFQTEVIPKLAASGWILDFNKAELLQITKVKDLKVQSSQSKEKNNWFELSFNMKLGKKQTSMLPIMQHLLSNYQQPQDLPETIYVPTEEGSVLSFSKSQIEPIFNTFLQLYGQQPTLPDSISIQPFEAHLIHGLSNAEITWRGSKDSLKLAEKLNSFKGITQVTPPKELQATLRNYQQFGLNWLNFLHEFNFSGILADDMGLGKTIQTLTWILKLKTTQRLKQPVLLIVPTSLIGNWKAEVKRFTPDLSILTLYGPDRAEHFPEIPQYDIVITSYPLITRDHEVLKDYNFTYLILDEAQKIKNPKTKLYQALQTLDGQHRLCLTGTPIENHLGELWSIFNFLMPGFLDNLPRFKKHYQNPIEKEGQTHLQKTLTHKVAPFLLRRTKKEVLTELPDKTEIIKVTEFEPDQANLYETIRLTMESKIRDVVAHKGLAKSQIMILDALLKLRQVCCDPSLVKIDSAKKVKHSAKLELLIDLVTELLEADNKVIIFSQFTSMLKIIEARLNKLKINYSLLTGQTRKREEAIEKFKQNQIQIFLISLKAGGVGLNLTEANTVIHYDPWWNPAVENQATDRAYRIGQNKEVFVYKLIVANTIEEKIIKLQEQKQALQDQIYNDTKQQSQANLTGKDLMALLNS